MTDESFFRRIQLYVNAFYICLRFVFMISLFQLVEYYLNPSLFRWFPVLSIIVAFLLSKQMLDMLRLHNLLEEDYE